MNKKPIICAVARHGCIRCQKLNVPLITKGYEIHMIANKMPMFGDHYATTNIYQHQDQLLNAIALQRNADVFIVHNEPSWFVSAIKNVLGDKPVILDVHDSMLIRVKPGSEEIRISVDERNNFQLADALVFPSEPMARLCCKEFALEQPCIALPSYVPRAWHRLDSWEWLGGVAYEGRIDLPEDLEGDEMKFFEYADFTEVATGLAALGIPFFLYTPGNGGKLQEHYKETAFWKGSYPFDKLLRKLGRHNWGFHGNVGKHLINRYAFPNKLFEYLAAGIPVIEMNAPYAGKFVEKHKVGIHVKSVPEIAERWGEHRELRKNVALRRFDWCMENHIHLLEELIEGLA